MKKQSRQLFNAVDDIVGTGIFKLLPRAIAIGYATGLGSGIGTHQDVNVHIADHKGLSGIDAHRRECFQDRLRMGLGMLHVISSHQVGDVVGYTQVEGQFVERLVPTRGCDAKRIALLLQLSQRLYDMREGLRLDGRLVLLKNAAVGIGAAINGSSAFIRIQCRKAAIERQPYRGSTLGICASGQSHLSYCHLHRRDDDSPGIAQRAVKVEYNQSCHLNKSYSLAPVLDKQRHNRAAKLAKNPHKSVFLHKKFDKNSGEKFCGFGNNC